MRGSKRWLVCLAAGLVSLLPWQRAIAAFEEPPTETAASKGIRLTRSGRFADAIPYLQQAAHDGAPQPFVIHYDLALCYYGAMQYTQAIVELEALRATGQDNAAVNKLLTQAYIAAGQPQQARAAFIRAQQQAPQDEKLYDFVADACNDHGEYALGLKFMDAGLTALPRSARLHYERGLFLAQLDRLSEALPAFATATALEPSGDIGVLAAVQSALYRNQLPQALHLIREAMAGGRGDVRLLSLLGTVLLQAGATPGEPTFVEAQRALEAAVAAQPGYAEAQLALGKLYLMDDHPAAAKEHLEAARTLEPRNASVYASLASAYGRLGQQEARRQSLAMLARLVGEKSARVAADGP